MGIVSRIQEIAQIVKHAVAISFSSPEIKTHRIHSALHKGTLGVLTTCICFICAGSLAAQSPHKKTPEYSAQQATPRVPAALVEIPATALPTTEEHTYGTDYVNTNYEVTDTVPIAVLDSDERCGTVENNEALRERFGGPSKEDFEQWMKETQKLLPEQRQMPSVITIPVVVHVIHNGETVGSLPNISDTQIQSQIDVLNEDFRRLNADTSNTPDVFKDVAADIQLEFCLATVDPDGNPTSGITRYNGHQSSYSREDLEYTIKPNTIWHPDYYFNIWCAPLEGGLLGYAQFPGNSTLPGFFANGGPAITDGIVIRDFAFGVGGTAMNPVDLGRIATHEAGHFFGLRHLGGDGDCTFDDYCNDTPTQNYQNGFYQSCAFNPLSQGVPWDDCEDGPGDLPDQFMNYMDYSNDACMNLFTQDQKARIAVVMANSPRRASLGNSQVCADIPPSTTFVPFPYAPENDLCFNAATLDCGDTKIGNTLSASPFDIPLECDIRAGGPGIWFTFEGGNDFTNLSLCGSGFDTRLNVYSGDCNGLTCVTGNDNACGLQSVVSFYANSGTTYYIYLSGTNGATGDYRLTRTCGASNGTSIGSSSNIFTVLLPEQNMVYASDSLDLVAFIHRQNIAIHGGDVGTLRYDISTDGGISFNSNVGVLNPMLNATARYPQITGLRTSASEDPLDQKLVWAGPTVSGSSWLGIVNGVADVTTTSPITSTEHYTFNTEPSYLGGGLCEGLPGEFWMFDQCLNGSVPGDSFYLEKGVYDGNTEDVTWSTYAWITPDHYTGYDGSAKITSNNIAFSPDGNTGWAAFLGDLNGGPDSTYQPIFIPSTDGGVTWGTPIEVNLNTINYIGDFTLGVTTLSEALRAGFPGVPGRPTCSFDFDLTVDNDGNPHMFVVVGNARFDASTPPEYSVFLALPKIAVDISSEDGGLTWTALEIAPISQLQYAIGSTNTLTMFNHPQISRSDDGTYLFYSWMDATTSGGVLPNLRVSGLRLSDQTLTCPKWITPGGPFDGSGVYPSLAPEVLTNAAQTGYKLPIVMTLLNNSGNTNDPVQHVYMGNTAVIMESDFTFDFASIDYGSCGTVAPMDQFGYTYEDCASTAFSWVDITTRPGAVEVDGLIDDNSVGPFPIGFDFRYYWTDQSQFMIGSNGWIGFNETGSLTQCFPAIPTSGGSVDNFIAPYLTDLTFDGAGNNGEVWYWSNQVDSLVISYLNVPYWTQDAPGFTGSSSFQVILTAQDSNIAFQYLETASGFAISDPSDLCTTDLQIGIENSNGQIGFLASANNPPDDSCRINFIYPESSDFVISDAAVLWNQNSDNRVAILDMNDTASLRAEIANVGNLGLSDIFVLGELTHNTLPAIVLTSSDTISGLAPGQAALAEIASGISLYESGNFSFTTNLINNADANLSNNSNTSEILVIDCQQETVKLDYNISDNVYEAFNWSGNYNRDSTGAAIFFDPPGADFRLDSIEAIIWQSSPENDQTITFKVIANDAPPGMGTLLFDTTLLKTEYPSLIPFRVPTGGIDVGENGFYIYWGGDLNTFLTSSLEPPFSRAGYEVLNGNWLPYRLNNAREFHIRTYGSCGPYPFAPANDLCANARFINCTDTLDGRTTGASSIGQPAPCVVNPDGPGVWYRFIGDGALATLSFSQVTFDANVTVYSGNCSSLSCVNGIAISNGQSASMDFPTTPGINYYIYVSGSPDDFGTFTIARTGACQPCPLSISMEASSNSPICTNGELLLSVEVTGDEPFYYVWSGPAQTWINGNTATPAAYGVSSGVFSVTVTNDCGAEVVSATQVIANGPPEITVLGPLVVPVDPSLCGAVITGAQLLPLVSATGSPPPQVTIPVNGSYPVGFSSVTATASNLCGSDDAVIDVYVIDNLPPLALCQDVSIELTEGGAVVTSGDLDAGSSDACGLQPILLNGTDSLFFDNEDIGFNHITMTVTDNNANQSVCQSVVYIVKDLCVNGSDLIDSDHGGLPDACDCSPFDDFNDRIQLREEINTGIDFDGVNDHLAIADAPGFNPSETNSITLEAWIKPDLSKQFNTIISRGGPGNIRPAYILNTYDYTNVGFNLAAAWNNSYWYTADSMLTPGVWTHVAVSYNHQDTSISFYYNGNLIKQTQVLYNYDAYDPGSEFGSQIIYIGRQGVTCNCNYYKGQMDEVRVWSTARTESEIRALLDIELRGNEEDLVAYYNFNDGIPEGDNTGLTIVKDMSGGGHNGGISGLARTGSTSNWISDTLSLSVANQDTVDLCLTCPDTTQIGMSFDGNDDEIFINYDPVFDPDPGSSFSFEAWVNPYTGTTAETILSKGHGGSVNTSYIFSIYQNKIALYMGDGVQSTWIYSDTDVLFNAWNHVAVSYDAVSGNFTFYLNGVADGVRTMPHGFFSDNSPVYLGRQGSVCDCNHFLGQMDEVRIWSEARSATQIQNFMHRGLHGGESGLEAYYTFNNGVPEGDNSNITTIPDASLNGRDGTVVDFTQTGSASNWVTTSVLLEGAQKAALDFDGSNDYITIPNHPDLIPTATNALTFEAWIYPGGDLGESIITESGNWPDRNHQIYLLGSSVWVTGTGVSPLVSTDTIPFNKWTHLSVVFDMTETRLYINGKLNNTRTQTLTASNLGFDVSIGNQAGGGPSDWNFLGKIDDVRYWDHARSASEIAQSMYQELTGSEEGLAAYYSFNEGVPGEDNTDLTTVHDLTGNGHEGTLHGFLQMGESSNWVSSPFNFGDGDRDGVPDVCDDCVPLRELILENQLLSGIYRAREKITLGPGLTLPLSGALELRAPTVRITELIPDLPGGTSWLVTPHACPNE